MQLFHFSPLLHLPVILREGITRGEVPIDPDMPHNQLPIAANLTTNGNPNDQIWTGGGPLNSLMVRFTVEVPELDLTSFREVKEQYHVRSKWLKMIAPYEHRRHWYFAFNGIRPDQIEKVELFDEGSYRQLSQLEVLELVSQIEQETSEKLEISTISGGKNAGKRGVRLRDHASDSWLIDGVKFRAARFMGTPEYPWKQQKFEVN